LRCNTLSKIVRPELTESTLNRLYSKIPKRTLSVDETITVLLDQYDSLIEVAK